MRDALRAAPVAGVLSEEVELPETLDPGAPLCVAIDPLDGSANLENNISVGTIFSIRPKGNDVLSTFFEPGTAQCAAGCFIYGPQTALVLAFDQCVDCFTLDPRTGEFVLTARDLRVPQDTLGIRHQRLEPAALERPGAQLHRRVPRRRERRARAGLQHALDRLAGGGSLSYPDARRRVPVSGGCAPGISRRPAAPAVRGASDRADHGMGWWRRVEMAARAFSNCRHARRISVCRSSWDRRAPCAMSMRSTSPSSRCSRAAMPCCSRGAACSADGGSHVAQTSHHLDHRLVRRRHHLGEEDVREHLPPRERGRGLYRGRRLPPLRPRRDA